MEFHGLDGLEFAQELPDGRIFLPEGLFAARPGSSARFFDIATKDYGHVPPFDELHELFPLAHSQIFFMGRDRKAV